MKGPEELKKSKSQGDLPEIPVNQSDIGAVSPKPKDESLSPSIRPKPKDGSISPTLKPPSSPESLSPHLSPYISGDEEGADHPKLVAFLNKPRPVPFLEELRQKRTMAPQSKSEQPLLPLRNKGLKK